MQWKTPIRFYQLHLGWKEIIGTCTFIIQSVIYKSFYNSKCLQDIAIKAQSIGENMFFG